MDADRRRLDAEDDGDALAYVVEQIRGQFVPGEADPVGYLGRLGGVALGQFASRAGRGPVWPRSRLRTVTRPLGARPTVWSKARSAWSGAMSAVPLAASSASVAEAAVAIPMPRQLVQAMLTVSS